MHVKIVLHQEIITSKVFPSVSISKITSKLGCVYMIESLNLS